MGKQEMVNGNQNFLDTLAIFHYVVGVFVTFFSSIFIIYVVIGQTLVVVEGPSIDQLGGVFDAEPVNEFFNWIFTFIGPLGWIFTIIGSIAVLLGWIFGISLILAGKRLKQRKNRMFCIVVATVTCMFLPLGPVLGILTLFALNKTAVQELFESGV